MIKLTRKAKQDIRDIITENTIVCVRKGGKKIWDCNCHYTKISEELKIEGDILRVNEQLIVNKIAEYIFRYYLLDEESPYNY